MEDTLKKEIQKLIKDEISEKLTIRISAEESSYRNYITVRIAYDGETIESDGVSIG